MDVDVIVLDLDNTILLDPSTGTGSQEIKNQAWTEVFPECDPEVVGGYIRKITPKARRGELTRKDVVSDLLNLSGFANPSRYEIDRRDKKYETITEDRIVTLGIPGEDRDVLWKLAATHRLYVNTATPALRASGILKRLNVLDVFVDVFGSERTKLFNNQYILSLLRMSGERAVLVDDSVEAVALAEECGMQFVGVTTKAHNAWEEGSVPFPTIIGLRELPSVLSKT